QKSQKMSSSATGVGMPICFLGAILLILTQKSSQKFGDVLGIMRKSGSKTKGECRKRIMDMVKDEPGPDDISHQV
ncbi:hypothetical protein, partial [Segatella copri]|uniref:hypothetical protein n=1 Tax=Segatella copri TaxID=165179 RepID=UPI001933527E